MTVGGLVVVGALPGFRSPVTSPAPARHLTRRELQRLNTSRYRTPRSNWISRVVVADRL